MFRIKVPATTGNLGAGFDVLGMALSIYNEIELDLNKDNTLLINVEGEGVDELPRDESNLVYRSIAEVFKRANEDLPGMTINLHNSIPLESGLGSSASAIVGGLVLGNRLLRNRYSSKQILNLAAQMEGHADNVSAALFGGLTINCYHGQELVCNVRRVQEDLRAVIVVPDLRVSTRMSREILPRNISLDDAVFNVGRATLLVSALTTGKYELLKIAMEDRLHQAYRYKLLPGMEGAIQKAYEAGALGAAISGSGPSLMCFAWEGLENIGQKAAEAFQNEGHSCKVIITQPGQNGVVILE